MMFKLAIATLLMVGAIQCDAVKTASSNSRAYFVANRPSAVARAAIAGQTQTSASAFHPAALRPRPSAGQQQQHGFAASGNHGSAVRVDLPTTSFTCSDKPYIPGIYADTEANCEVYHVCTPNYTFSFACGEGTAFDQSNLTCNYPTEFQCSQTANFYSRTAGIGVETGIETPAVQKTSFTCAGKPFVPGYYADQETGCATYHFCLGDQQFDFNCGAGTFFSQEKLTCVYQDEADCANAQSHWNSNQGIGVSA